MYTAAHVHAHIRLHMLHTHTHTHTHVHIHIYTPTCTPTPIGLPPDRHPDPHPSLLTVVSDMYAHSSMCSDVGWKLVAQGSKGEKGCSIDSQVVRQDDDKDTSLTECQDFCKGTAFMAYHYGEVRWCTCFDTCQLTRPAEDYTSVADTYEWTTMTG